jgi:hypothetical protein
MPVVLYGYGTRYFTIREKFTLRVFENRISRRIFGPKRGEKREWRRLHNDYTLIRISIQSKHYCHFDFSLRI